MALNKTDRKRLIEAAKYAAIRGQRDARPQGRLGPGETTITTEARDTGTVFITVLKAARTDLDRMAYRLFEDLQDRRTP